MKRLLPLLLAATFVGASADDVAVEGRIRSIDLHPDVVIVVETPYGHKTVFLGTNADWEGKFFDLERRDQVTITGHKEPGSDRIVAEKMWVGSTYFELPARMTMRSSGASATTIAGIRAVLTPTVAMANEVIAGWMDKPKKTAEFMLDKYGAPDELTSHRMVWKNNGPWKMSILTNEEIPHNFPMPHHDMLLQVIDYKVPVDKFDDLAEYDGSVVVERTKGEIGARCDKEAANFLAINLANDVSTGAKTAAEARRFYADTVQAMMTGSMTTQQRDYTSRFVFNMPRSNTADPDRRHGG